MRSFRKEMLEYINHDISRGLNDFRNMQEYLKTSSAVFTRGQLQTLCVPFVLSEEVRSEFSNAVKTMYSIIVKVIDEYLQNKKYRELFMFSKELEELILCDCGYSENLPIARIDIFFNEDTNDFKFCEFNADGASAMNEDRELGNGWENTSLYQNMLKHYEISKFELFDTWVEAFLKIYSQFASHKPNIAIIDFLDIATKSEFKVFKEAFAKKGINTVIEDIRNLKFNNGVLVDSNNNKIDAVYRRAVTAECMKNFNDIQDFINAYKEKKVCVIGSFKTQIIHNKNIFWILSLPETRKILTKQEENFIDRHLPITYKLQFTYEEIKEKFFDKDKWILKPDDRYGSVGVIDGASVEEEKWLSLLTKLNNTDYIIQEYCKPYKTENIYFDNIGNLQQGDYNNLIGMYVYSGNFVGTYSRCMLDRITTPENEGRVTYSIVAKKI